MTPLGVRQTTCSTTYTYPPYANTAVACKRSVLKPFVRLQSVTCFVASYVWNKFRCVIHTYTYSSVAVLKICYSENEKYKRKKEVRHLAEIANCVVIFTTNVFCTKKCFCFFSRSQYTRNNVDCNIVKTIISFEYKMQKIRIIRTM